MAKRLTRWSSKLSSSPEALMLLRMIDSIGGFRDIPSEITVFTSPPADPALMDQ
jgi:hypothetical protein